jgi:hypothetical protein
MDLTQYAIAVTAIIGLINGVQFAFDRNWRAFTFFILALVAGTAFGFLKWFGLPSLEIGFGIGVSSSGVYKGLQVLSNSSIGAPKSV